MLSFIVVPSSLVIDPDDEAARMTIAVPDVLCRQIRGLGLHLRSVANRDLGQVPLQTFRNFLLKSAYIDAF